MESLNELIDEAKLEESSSCNGKDKLIVSKTLNTGTDTESESSSSSSKGDRKGVKSSKSIQVSGSESIEVSKAQPSRFTKDLSGGKPSIKNIDEKESPIELESNDQGN